MNLNEITVKVLNIDIIYAKSGKEYFKMQGLYPLSEKQKKNILCGEFQVIEIFEEFEKEFEQVCADAKKIDSICVQGYFTKGGFRPVSFGKIIYKKDK